ncbi:MAG: methyltransferase domain-containing protein [Candidatus Diapherotrites archaeon]|nr:methyltransferase domain-containing protein [Candidatus Diapherotrites archaeon]
MADIERALMFDLRGDIAKRIKSGQRPNVLDWGCGNGRAIKRLGRKFNGRINAYGYSDMLYKGWQKEKNVKYIHATKEDMLRYFKNSSLDIIYSHIGLFYLDTDVVKYTGMLLPKLKVGGILLSDIPRLHQLFPKSIELQGMGFKSTFKSGENQVLLIRREK